MLEYYPCVRLAGCSRNAGGAWWQSLCNGGGREAVEVGTEPVVK